MCQLGDTNVSIFEKIGAQKNEIENIEVKAF